MNNTTVVESRNERSETKALRCNLRAVLLLRAGQRFMLIAPILVPFFCALRPRHSADISAGVVL